MPLLKYHILTVISLLIASYSGANLLNGIVVRLYGSPGISGEGRIKEQHLPRPVNLQARVQEILKTPLFESLGVEEPAAAAPKALEARLDELQLLGTVTGPVSIARALIRKKSEKNPGIFSLYRSYYDNTTNDVYGYTLIAITETRVYLMRDKERFILDLFDTRPKGSGSSGSSSNEKITKTLSRSFLQQKVYNNLDEALKGIQAGPNMNGSVVDGYRLVQLQPINILYHLGLRAGDIVHRINGKKIDSTTKLMQMWEGMKNDRRVVLDFQRGNNVLTLEINVTE